MSSYMCKSANDERDYAIDWALEGDESLLEDLGWTIVPQELDPLALALVSARTEAGVSRVVLRGGRPGHIYHVACRVRTSAGRVLTRGFLLRITES